jgi:hypothetical protein
MRPNWPSDLPIVLLASCDPGPTHMRALVPVVTSWVDAEDDNYIAVGRIQNAYLPSDDL